jgi:hypothetical protein
MARGADWEEAPALGAPPNVAYEESGNSVAASIANFKTLITRLRQKRSEHGACALAGNSGEISRVDARSGAMATQCSRRCEACKVGLRLVGRE